MDLELKDIVIVSAFGGVSLVLLALVITLFVQVAKLRKQLRNSPSVRVQKLRMDDKNHAFQNPTISPDEELSRRGYSMYVPNEDDVESGRGNERQTGGQFVEELARELDSRQQRQNAPPFLLQSIQENKRKSHLANPVSNGNHGRQSETNPNFIY